MFNEVKRNIDRAVTGADRRLILTAEPWVQFQAKSFEICRGFLRVSSISAQSIDHYSVPI
jgi:hypothetical protein